MNNTSQPTRFFHPSFHLCPQQLLHHGPIQFVHQLKSTRNHPAWIMMIHHLQSSIHHPDQRQITFSQSQFGQFLHSPRHIRPSQRSLPALGPLLKITEQQLRRRPLTKDLIRCLQQTQRPVIAHFREQRIQLGRQTIHFLRPPRRFRAPPRVQQTFLFQVDAMLLHPHVTHLHLLTQLIHGHTRRVLQMQNDVQHRGVNNLSKQRQNIHSLNSNLSFNLACASLQQTHLFDFHSSSNHLTGSLSSPYPSPLSAPSFHV